jgi:threonine dehydrogenase-like Zn-dependent dehydrogenase
MSRVRAAVMMGPGRIEVEEFPWPDLEPGAVLLRVIYSGICGTDKHTYRGETKQYVGTPHERDITFPLLCGHENVGIIAAIGGADTIPDSEGKPLHVGDRIVPGSNVPCGTCYYCRNDFPYYACRNLQDYGNSLTCASPPYLFGGWAEYMYLLPGTPLFRVPEDLPSNVAVLTELMAVTHGLDLAKSFSSVSTGFRYGDTVAVVGVGPLGLCHLIKARLLGCGDLVAIDRFPSRLKLAESFGATLTLNVDETTSEERQQAVQEITDGRGADIVIDCSGVPQTFPESLKLVRFGGMVLEVGAFVDLGPVSINPNADVCMKNVCILGVGGEAATSYVPAMRVLARNLDRLPLDRIVSHRFSLDEASRALDVSQSDPAMKVAIAPNGMEE